MRCPGDAGSSGDRPRRVNWLDRPSGAGEPVGTRVTAQVRLNRSEVGRRTAQVSGRCDPALRGACLAAARRSAVRRLQEPAIRRPVCDPALWAETSGLPDGVVDRGGAGCTVVRLLEQPLVIDGVIIPGERGRELRAVQDASLFAGFTRRWVQARRVAIADTVTLEAKLCGVGCSARAAR